jgi:hypothetical protein
VVSGKVFFASTVQPDAVGVAHCGGRCAPAAMWAAGMAAIEQEPNALCRTVVLGEVGLTVLSIYWSLR